MKLAKYLPEFGWRPTVLTGARATVGLPEDPALAAQVAGIEVIRSRAPEFSLFYDGRATRGGAKAGEIPVARHGAPRRGKLHPKAWLVPDSQVLWYPFAVRAGLRRAHAGGWDVIVATSFPPTAILIAHTIAARLRVPYVADFRDAWTRYAYAPQRPAPLAELERRLEMRMIRDAGAVVTVDAPLVDHAFARLAPENRPPLHVIQNGYDEDDFRDAMPAQLPAFSIVHTGRLRRSTRPLWDALTHAMGERPELRGRLHVWQVGVVDPGVADLQSPPEGRDGACDPAAAPARGDRLHARRGPAVVGGVRVSHAVESAAVPAGGTPAARAHRRGRRDPRPAPAHVPRPISWTAAMRRGSAR